MTWQASKFHIRLSVEESQWVPVHIQHMYHRALEKLRLPTSYEVGNATVIMGLDGAAQRASRLVEYFYPPEVVDRLYNKSTVAGFLGEHGFPILWSRTIASLDEITGNDVNFILKPTHSQGGVYALGNRGPLDYKRFANKYQLIDQVPTAGAELLKGYTIQQADVRPQQTELIMRGTINENSEVYWCRDTTIIRENARFNKIRREWGDPNFLGLEKKKLQRFIKAMNIRCAAFMLVCIQMKDMQLYPIDWNFRLGDMFNETIKASNQDELLRALAHQFSVTTELPDKFPGVIVTTGDWFAEQKVMEIL